MRERAPRAGAIGFRVRSARVRMRQELQKGSGCKRLRMKGCWMAFGSEYLSVECMPNSALEHEMQHQPMLSLGKNTIPAHSTTRVMLYAFVF
jgi:hypothetical protein